MNHFASTVLPDRSFCSICVDPLRPDDAVYYRLKIATLGCDFNHAALSLLSTILLIAVYTFPIFIVVFSFPLVVSCRVLCSERKRRRSSCLESDEAHAQNNGIPLFGSSNDRRSTVAFLIVTHHNDMRCNDAEVFRQPVIATKKALPFASSLKGWSSKYIILELLTTSVGCALCRVRCIFCSSISFRIYEIRQIYSSLGSFSCQTVLDAILIVMVLE